MGFQDFRIAGIEPHSIGHLLDTFNEFHVFVNGDDLCPLRANSRAIAVPKAPKPMTANCRTIHQTPIGEYPGTV
jgi:hypothetical protein